jgi:3-oxoacyl-[acyl-carrier protein] reductase
MDLELRGRVALVTGASAGIGEGIARSLAAEGAQLALVARRAEPLANLAPALVSDGAPAPLVLAGDVSRETDREWIVSEASNRLGAIDILVNSAGGRTPPGTPRSDAVWREAMDLGFEAHRKLIERVAPGMCERGWGRIINITGKSEPPRASATFAAKAAMHAWSKGLSRDVGPHGVTVNCLAPGKVMTEQMLRNYTGEERAAQAREIPLGRFAEPIEIGWLTTFLASPRAAYINGTVIPFDAGLRRYAF